jgi:Heavy metal associated domain 2
MKLPPLESLPLPIHIKILSSTPGRIRLRAYQQHGQAEVMGQIANTLKAFFSQIRDVRINVQTGSITVYYDGEISSFEDTLTKFGNFVIVINDVATGKSQVAAAVTNAMAYLNHRVEQTTNGFVDLRFLFPMFLALLALRQYLVKGPGLSVAPWHVFAWYAFDSFLKLNDTDETSEVSQKSSQVEQSSKKYSNIPD